MNAYTKKVRDTSLALYAALNLFNQKKAELEKKQAAGTIAAVDSMKQLEENATIFNNAKIATLQNWISLQMNMLPPMNHGPHQAVKTLRKT